VLPELIATDGANFQQTKDYQHAKSYQQSDVLANNDMLTESFTPPQSLIPDDWQPQWQQETLADERLDKATNATGSPAAIKQTSATAGCAHANAEQCLHAFLSALNVPAPPAQLLQNPAWWGQLGEALQASLHGIIAVMRARSELKNTLRVNQTTFQQRENNPLKFSANVNEAFHNLFNHNASSFMAPRQAISAAFADMSQHEAAIIAGAAGSMQGLLSQLTPQLIEQRDFGVSFIDKVNPTQRYSRYWNLYQGLHQELLAEVTLTAKGGVNDDFIRAYEDYLTNLK
jgi:type VI secretion system protein ImpI